MLITKTILVFIILYFYFTTIRSHSLIKSSLVMRHIVIPSNTLLAQINKMKGLITIAFTQVVLSVLLFLLAANTLLYQPFLNNLGFVIGYGILLGIGELGFSLLIYQFIIVCKHFIKYRETRPIFNSKLMIPPNQELVQSIYDMKISGRLMLIFLLCILNASEEFIFRGVLISSLLPFGMTLAFVLPIILFVFLTIQNTYHERRIFSLVNKLLISVIHGILFMKTQLILPLIVAYVTFDIILLFSKD